MSGEVTPNVGGGHSDEGVLSYDYFCCLVAYGYDVDARREVVDCDAIGFCLGVEDCDAVDAADADRQAFLVGVDADAALCRSDGDGSVGHVVDA